MTPSSTAPAEAARPPAQEACPLAAWGCRTGLEQPDWQLMSSHATSAGSVEYCRCTCAAVVLLHEGEVAAFAAADPA
ncbi:hypothetical protein [Streptomyces sp. CA-132043]|uniref:hypothetical protein n=1 Tax=Streptomyces sp. CA-132043 TaxID=3240048 RepID=UPI003D89F44C